MRFEKYELEDFLEDRSFYNWVHRKNQQDIDIWESWWNHHPERHTVANEAVEIIKNLTFEESGFSEREIDRLWARIKHRTNQQPAGIFTTHTRKNWNFPYALRVAAVIVPLLLVAMGYLLFHQGSKQVPTMEVVERHVPRGQKLTIYLPDGTRVKLNSESRISYVEPFEQNHRMVSLDGEAFFEVTPDQNRPFIVISRNVETRVLGTSFNITAYADEPHISVAVVTGKVSVEKVIDNPKSSLNKDLVVLSPSEQVTFFEDDQQKIVSTFDPKTVLAWNEGTLFFDNATINEFVSELERWYGIDILVERDTPIKKGIVGEFKNQSLEEIMMGMHVASEFDYEFKDGKLIIK